MTMLAGLAERRHSLHLSGGENTKEPAPPREGSSALCTAALPGATAVLQEHENRADRQYHIPPTSCSKCPAHVNTQV